MRTEQRTIYISDDGTEFRERTACEAYETQHRCVAEVMARIPKTELGHGQKTEGVDGGDFARLYLSEKPEDREKAIEYLRQDVRLTLAAAKRMGVV